MTQNEIVEVIGQQIREFVRSRGMEPPEVHSHTVFLGGNLPIDSLDLASLVVELEGRTGKDPFKSGFVNFRTVGELAELYAE